MLLRHTSLAYAGNISRAYAALTSFYFPVSLFIFPLSRSITNAAAAHSSPTSPASLPPSPHPKTYRAVVNLVEEDGKVQGKAQADGVGRGQVMLGDVGGALVGRQGGIR